jgi:hypothetical protein
MKNAHQNQNTELKTGLKKVTAILPAELIESSLALSGKNLTETLKQALEQLTRSIAYQQIRSHRGKMHLDIDLKALRED